MHLIKLFGIPFRFHPLFIMIMILSLMTGYFIELLTLFSIVFIHELGHVIAAKRYRWRIREVQMLPFGGVMSADEQGTVSAKEEMIVALAGPLQNGLLILLALALQSFGWWDDSWSQYFIQANIMIGCFNLLPITPLDGGKVMLALLSYPINYYESIVWSTWISLILSGLLILASFVTLHTTGIQLNFLLIGLFLFYSNIYQLRHVHYHYIRFLVNRELRAVQMIDTGSRAQPIVVRQSHYIRDIIHMFMRERYHLIYVIDEQGAIRAVLPEQRLINRFMLEKKPGSAVSDLFMLE